MRTPFGMSLNSLAETQLAPQGYAALTFDARGHGQSEGLVSIDGPREIQDVRELFNWLAAQPGINGQRIGAFGYSYGGGAIWRATAEGVPFAAIEPAITWTDLYSALLPQNLARSGVVLGFWQSIAARAAPELEPIVNDALAGRNLGVVRAFADQRSSRALLGNIRAPTFLMQGRRDFAFDIDHALAAYSRLKAPKRLYLGDFGHAPSPLPPAEAQHVLPEARQWFDRYLKGLPNGIDTAAAGGGRSRSVDRPHVLVPVAAGAQDAATRVPRPEGDQLDRQGRPHASAQEGEARDVRVAGASCRALEPERLAARRRRPFSGHAAGEGDRRQLRRRPRPARLEAEAGRDPADQPADERPAAVAPSPDRGRHIDGAEPGEPPLSVRRAALGATRRRPGPAHAPGPRRSRSRADPLTRESMGLLTPSAIFV